MKKEIDNTAVKDIIDLFKLKKERKAIKNRKIRDIRNLFEHEEEENYYKPVRVGNFWRNSYIEYKSNSETNKTASVETYINETKPS